MPGLYANPVKNSVVVAMSFGRLDVYSYADLRHLRADILLEVLGEIVCFLHGEIGVDSEV